MPKVRTTISPTEELDVGDAELLDLRRRGLVLEGTRAHTDEGLTAAAVRQVLGENPAAPAAPATSPAPAPPTPKPTRQRRARASRRGATTAVADTPAPAPDATTSAAPTDPGDTSAAGDSTATDAPSGQNQES